MELLKFDREIDELIAKGATLREMSDVAAKSNLKSSRRLQ